MSGILTEGDLVQFLDSKGRKYQVVLKQGKEFHSHSGFVPHADVIGLAEGSRVHTGRGQAYMVMRPTLSEFILKMPRGAQVIYPKDIGPILMLADIGPGVRVLESGVGSGALSMAMLRAGAEIIGYELREDFANRARSNVEQFLGPADAGALPGRAARLLRRHRRRRRSTASCSTSPNRGRSCPTPRPRCVPAASWSPTRRASSR